jgi:hypothetical protein
MGSELTLLKTAKRCVRLCLFLLKLPLYLVQAIIDDLKQTALSVNVILIEGDTITAIGDSSIIPAGAKMIKLPGAMLTC